MIAYCEHRDEKKIIWDKRKIFNWTFYPLGFALE